MSDEVKRDQQPPLLELQEVWERNWQEMPDFKQRNEKPYDSIHVQFRSAEDRRAFLTLIGEPPARRQSIWWPKMEVRRQSDQNAEPTTVAPNRYPIYVISKGRWERPLTVRALEKLGINYQLVVEPQEAAAYEQVLREGRGYGTLTVLPFANLGLGSIPARNWVWDAAIEYGLTRHWILDDNIDGFYRLHDNQKWRITDENPFAPIEAWADRYTNVAIAGMQYEFFADRRSTWPAFNLNTRVYSCILLRNDLPYRWRGRYNEDTDLSLRALKDGWVTALFYAYLCKKMPTLTMRGGNTDELYQDDGRLRMAESLRAQHPDVVRVVEKWGRWQHHVDYRAFERNKLIPRAEK